MPGPVRAALPPVTQGRVTASPVKAKTATLTPASLYPLRAPVRAPIPQQVRGGTAQGRDGTFSGEGPVPRPLTSPVRASLPLQPVLTGRAMAMGALEVTTTIPAVAPIPPRGQPWQAASRTLPPRGTARSRSGPYSGTGPALTALRGPARARQPLPAPGRVYGAVRPAAYAPAPTSGPALTPLHVPVRAPIPARPRGGTSISRNGTWSGTGEPVPPLAQPAGIRVVFARTGHIQASRPVTATAAPTSGPQLYPLTAPVRARQPLPPAGRALGIYRAVPVPPTAGPALYPLRQPVRGRLPLPPPGRAMAMGPLEVTQTGPTSGPVLTPLRSPVRAPIPARTRGGYARSSTGTYSGTGPSIRPLTGPLRARQPLPPQGHTQGTRQGTRSGEGPALRPLTAPVRAGLPRLPVLPGRVQATAKPAAVAAPTTGPAIPPRSQPVPCGHPGAAPRRHRLRHRPSRRAPPRADQRTARLPAPAASPGEAAAPASRAHRPRHRPGHRDQAPADQRTPIPPRAQPVRAILPPPSWHGHGTAYRPAVAPYLLAMFRIPAARQQWTVTDAQQQWAVTDARQLWTVTDARNGP